MTEPGANTVPSALATTGTIAAVTLKRLLRGRMLWVGAVIAALPIAFAAILAAVARGHGPGLTPVRVATELLIAVLAALFVASSIGEDIEDQTTTYLWSRPVPRTAIVIGKLVVVAPIVAALIAGSWAIAAGIMPGEAAPPASIAGFAAGALAAAMAAAGIGTLVPRHGMALAIVYMMFNVFIGALPMSLRKLSITYHAVAVVDPAEPSHLGSALWLIGIAAVWLWIALWRIRKLEA